MPHLLILLPWQFIVNMTFGGDIQILAMLPFPEYHIAGITLYVAFSDRPLSPSNDLRFLHIF
jgi:hypothetical protein